MFAFYVVVDSVYIKSFGRRKSWLVPVQYMIGIFLFILSYKISALIGGGFTPTKDGGEHYNYVTLAQVTGVNGFGSIFHVYSSEVCQLCIYIYMFGCL